MARPTRLDGFEYRGVVSCFLTICTRDRVQLFTSPPIVAFAIDHLRQSADQYRVAVLAYCFMPDHLHLLVRGLDDETDLDGFARLFKQKTAYYAKRQFGVTLWQAGYHDRVVRRDDSVTTRIRYVLDNPIRAGLVRTLDEYPFWGSFTMTRAECLDMVEED